MAQSFGGEFQQIEVTTDELVRGLPKKQVWVAAAKPKQAIALVSAEVPEGWTASLSDARLTQKKRLCSRCSPARSVS
jgi:hypothetical protein